MNFRWTLCAEKEKLSPATNISTVRSKNCAKLDFLSSTMRLNRHSTECGANAAAVDGNANLGIDFGRLGVQECTALFHSVVKDATFAVVDEARPILNYS